MGRVAWKVVSHFGDFGFAAGNSIDEIDDLHQADRTTASVLHVVYSSRKVRDKLMVSCGALSCQVHGFPAGAHGGKVPRPRCGPTRQPRWRLMEQLQDPRCGSTRPQAFIEAASRPPAVVDSSTALAFNEAAVRA